MRVLIMTDSAFIPTGQAKVGREIAVGLAKRGHQVGYLGWWHRNDIFPNLPHNIQFWWTNNGLYGADVLDEMVGRFQPEVLLTIGDFWNIAYIADPASCRTRKYFQWCSYIPVDGEPEGGGLPPGIIDVVKDIDLPVAYTDYAKEAVLKSVHDQETRNRIRTIYHGVDTSIFKPADPAERRRIREQYGLQDKFVFLTVSRNQSRKHIPELMKAWQRFMAIPEFAGKAILWPHMNFQDPNGWDIDDLIRVLKLNNEGIMYYEQIAHGASYLHMMPEAELAKLYQIADAFILISSEGFGLPTIEAMATKLPCILLDHAASAEIGGDGRAHLVQPSGSIMWTGRYLTNKPIPDVDLTVDAMVKIFREKKYRDEIAAKGYDFAKKYTWESVVDQWHMLLLEQEVPFIKQKNLEVVV